MQPKQVSLTSFIRYPSDSPIFPSLTSLPIPNNRKKPDNKLICVYGTSNVQSYLKEEMQKAYKENDHFLRVNIKIAPGEIPVSKISLSHISELYFLNIWRLNQEAAQYFYDLMNFKKHKKYYKKIKINDLLKFVDEKPHFLNKIWEQEEFAHISAISWPAFLSDKAYDVRQMAAVKPNDIQEIAIRNYKGDPNNVKIEP